ncbi:hypothetical protein D9C73_025942 [Collichthys lucidus]|uniref:Uncharacterized protein n=1 Tax=Collichthys lucidus TaxID=240159 RepID=A0A4U5VTI0_COLLU|nr:hypothetical protein D9C73_025942 [Collichthys lucidus]
MGDVLVQASKYNLVLLYKEERQRYLSHIKSNSDFALFTVTLERQLLHLHKICEIDTSTETVEDVYDVPVSCRRAAEHPAQRSRRRTASTGEYEEVQFEDKLIKLDGSSSSSCCLWFETVAA